MHLTLQFLGEVPADTINDVCLAVTEAVADCEPLELEIRGLGAFPNARRPRTIWLGVAAGCEELAAVQKRAQKALKKLGFKPESRAFSPHLTLGRVREGTAELAERIARQPDQSYGRSPISEVVVFSSQLRPGGPIYAALCRAPLGSKK
jgi:2'-5' RNA ligase